jgi:hypothetical protein
MGVAEEAPPGPVTDSMLFFRFTGRVVSVLVVFSLPHGKLAAFGKSGGYAHFGQKPTVQNKPDDENAKNSNKFHNLPPIYFFQYISCMVAAQENFAWPSLSRLDSAQARAIVLRNAGFKGGRNYE